MRRNVVFYTYLGMSLYIQHHTCSSHNLKESNYPVQLSVNKWRINIFKWLIFGCLNLDLILRSYIVRNLLKRKCIIMFYYDLTHYFYFTNFDRSVETALLSCTVCLKSIWSVVCEHYLFNKSVDSEVLYWGWTTGQWVMVVHKVVWIRWWRIKSGIIVCVNWKTRWPI